MRKPVSWVCDQGRLKPVCSAIGASQRLENLDIETRSIILSRQWTTKALIIRTRRLIYAFVVRIWHKQVFTWPGSIYNFLYSKIVHYGHCWNGIKIILIVVLSIQSSKLRDTKTYKLQRNYFQLTSSFQVTVTVNTSFINKIKSWSKNIQCLLSISLTCGFSICSRLAVVEVFWNVWQSEMDNWFAMIVHYFVHYSDDEYIILCVVWVLPWQLIFSTLEYRKFPKYSDTRKICCNHSKIWTMWLYHRVMSPNNADGMANSVDPDKKAPLGAVWSGSALFAQAYLCENLGSLWYFSANDIILK